MSGVKVLEWRKPKTEFEQRSQDEGKLEITEEAKDAAC